MGAFVFSRDYWGKSYRENKNKPEPQELEK